MLMFGWAGVPKSPDLGLANILMLVAILFPGFVGAFALWRDRRLRAGE
jgi:hypothetical protein